MGAWEFEISAGIIDSIIGILGEIPFRYRERSFI